MAWRTEQVGDLDVGLGRAGETVPTAHTCLFDASGVRPPLTLAAFSLLESGRRCLSHALPPRAMRDLPVLRTSS